MPDPPPHSSLARRTAVVGGVLALIASATVVAWKAVPALLLIFCAFLVALLLSGLAGIVARRTGMRYGLALALSGCASQPKPESIPAVAETRQCPAFPLPPPALLKPPVMTDFLTPTG